MANKKDISIGPEDAAAYIADMAAYLRGIAKNAELDFLVYLLEMTHEEALSHFNGLAGERAKKPG